jgi:hypothetical protein
MRVLLGISTLSGRMILKWAIKEWFRMAWTAFNWLRTGTKGVVL